MLDISILSKNKIIFFAVVGILLFMMIIGISMLGSGSSKKLQNKAPKELTIWVVGDESAGFSEIITGFKKSYPDYKNTDIKITKFGNYKDYEETLMRVSSDGNAPDIFVVNSADSGLLESKILAIPADIIKPDDFSKNFNKIFDNLVIENKEKDGTGSDKTIAGIKGIPLGYQAMGVFYNWKLIKSIPRIWSDIGKNKTNNIDPTNESENVPASDGDDYTDIMLGIEGRYLPGAPDILSMLFLQNNISSYEKFGDTKAIQSLSDYYSFSGKTSPSTFARLQSTMKDLNLTTTDMFVRGKIGMIIGFPSLLKEIEYSIKRAGSEGVLSNKNLRTSEIPQISLNPKDAINLGEYNYFALSKTSPNIQAGYSFLAYLTTGDAQDKYLQSFPMYLPAQRTREESKMSEAISKDFDRVKYRSFMNPDTILQTFDKGLKNEYDFYLSQIIGSLNKDPKTILADVLKYIDCNKKHFIEGVEFDIECKLEW